MDNQSNKIVVFQEKTIRRVWHNEEWWFSIIDVISALTASPQPSRYWNELRAKMQLESGNDELFANTEKLKMESLDGKMRATEATNTEGMFRIIQSVPSPKAEPFKQWFAKVAYERVQEIENPELAANRARQYYKDLGYSDPWIAARLKSVEVRDLFFLGQAFFYLKKSTTAPPATNCPSFFSKELPDGTSTSTRAASPFISKETCPRTAFFKIWRLTVS